MVSRLCSLTADLIVADSHLETSASALQLRNASADLDTRILQESSRADQTPDGVEARILLVRQHDLAFREAARDARKRLIALSTSQVIGLLCPHVFHPNRDAWQHSARGVSVRRRLRESPWLLRSR
jgi:hypothetical protein